MRTEVKRKKEAWKNDYKKQQTRTIFHNHNHNHKQTNLKKLLQWKVRKVEDNVENN